MLSAAVHPAAAMLGGLVKWVGGVDVQWLWRPFGPLPRVYFANH